MEEKIEMTLKEIEELDYYSFMAYINVPTFVIGGIESTMELVSRCYINSSSKVLIIGCGTGGTAVHLAKKIGCKIVGIDIAELMVIKANERARQENVADLCEFLVGDVHKMDFADSTFDVVISEFVTQFLNISIAFVEIIRVLKPGGYFGLNEMTKENNIPNDIIPLIQKAENTFKELTELDFKINSLSVWEDSFKSAGFTDITSTIFHKIMGKSSFNSIVKDMGGWGQFFKIMGTLLKFYRKSEKLKSKFRLISQAKRTLLRNRKVKPYVGYALCVGKKE